MSRRRRLASAAERATLSSMFATFVHCRAQCAAECRAFAVSFEKAHHRPPNKALQRTLLLFCSASRGCCQRGAAELSC